MGSKYLGITSSGYNAGSPPDDGTQVASNLITWAGVKTKLADPIKTLADAENTALVTALDLSARAISSPDTAIASDHWKTLQVSGATTVTLSSAASMGAGYEVGVFNAGVGVVTVTPGAAADTINGVSASVTVSIKGTKIFRTNQALTGYNVVGGFDPQTVTASSSVVTPVVGTLTDAQFGMQVNSSSRWAVLTSANGYDFVPNADNASGLGEAGLRIKQVYAPIIDTGTTGSGALKTNNGTTVLTWANDLSVKPAGLLDLTTATAGQIGFPATQNTSAGANVLDDYEEGTWTPSVGGNATYTVQTGTYTKIGRMVFIRFTITINVLGTGSSATVSGLPFTSIAGYNPLSISGQTGLQAAFVSVTAGVDSAAATISFNTRTAANASEAFSSVIFINGSTISVAGCYQTT